MSLILASLCLSWAQAPLPGLEQDRAEVDAAIQQYLEGDPGGARNRLEQLLGRGPELEAGIRQDALAWLGDILYSEDGERAARTIFMALLAENPSYQLDAFQHPPEVVAYFESLRPPPVVTQPLPELRPFPSMILAPGGMYYYLNGRPIAGATLTILQLGSLAGSAALYFELKSLPAEVKTEADVQRAQTLRALNWSLAGVGWLSLTVPILVESSRWGVEQRAQVSMGPGGVVLSGSF
jgi:hypothetical protein